MAGEGFQLTLFLRRCLRLTDYFATCQQTKLHQHIGRTRNDGLTLSPLQMMMASLKDFSTRSRDLEALNPRRSCMNAENCCPGTTRNGDNA